MPQGINTRNSPSVVAAPTDDSFRLARERIAQGELVAFPTETVYGLGGDATNDRAVQRIFKVKGRPSTNPLIVHVSSPERIPGVSGDRLEPHHQTLLERLDRFFPGPLTVVIPRGSHISPYVSCGTDTVAVRVPAHDIARRFLEIVSVPIAAPSANPSGYVSPTTALHVADSLPDKGILILDGGACEIGIESTVLSLIDSRPRLLRPGAISKEEIERALAMAVDAHRKNEGDEQELSPGLLSVHYSPRTPAIIKGSLPLSSYPMRVGFIAMRNPRDAQEQFPYTRTIALSEHGDLEEIARNLFAGLRSMDDGTLDLIVIEPCDEQGIGVAIMDRVRRATARDR